MVRNLELCLVILSLFALQTKLCSSNTLHNSTCYCLVEELSNLRNPIHIEATVLQGRNVYLLAEQIGVIWEYNPKKSKNKLTTYLDISKIVLSEKELMNEHGLLGFALHPKFRDNKKIFLYTIRTLADGDVMKRYVVISLITGQEIDGEKLLLAIEQPGTKRNGGQLLFGDDGYLYIMVGDGGPDTDVNIQAQNGSSLLGKVLRIDVDKSTVVDFRPRFYDIPSDNPTEHAWRPEIYAIGSRNMWRCGIDRGDKQGKGRGRIFCGDLGSSIAEEINKIQKGANYGWPNWEGSTCYTNKQCKGTDNVLPVLEFRGDDQAIQAIVGGPLYRQTKFPDLTGQLVFGDFVSGAMFTTKEHIVNASLSKWSYESFPRCDKTRCGCNARDVPRSYLLSFGETHTDELLLLMTDEPAPDRPRGALLRLEPPVGDNMTCSAVNIVTTKLLHLIILSYFVHFYTTFTL